MTDGHGTDAAQIRDANDRYWSSDASVNQIADELGLSKSSLYSLIDQLPTGLACPDCASELAYANRTARDRGLVSCVVCGFQGTDEDQDAVDRSQIAVPPRPGLETPQGRTVAGAALLGLAVGLLIGSLARR